MVRQDGAELRKMRTREIAQTVLRRLTQIPTLNLSEVLPELQYETGLTKERITEYLQIIAATGRFDIDVASGKISRIPIPQATAEQILESARGPTSG